MNIEKQRLIGNSIPRCTFPSGNGDVYGFDAVERLSGRGYYRLAELRRDLFPRAGQVVEFVKSQTARTCRGRRRETTKVSRILTSLF